MRANDMSEGPISCREFNLGMESLRDVLKQLAEDQQIIASDVKQLQGLHRDCMFAQAERAYKAGQLSEKILVLEEHSKAADNERLNERLSNVSHKRQLTTGIILTALASVASLITTFFTRK